MSGAYMGPLAAIPLAAALITAVPESTQRATPAVVVAAPVQRTVSLVTTSDDLLNVLFAKAGKLTAPESSAAMWRAADQLRAASAAPAPTLTPRDTPPTATTLAGPAMPAMPETRVRMTPDIYNPAGVTAPDLAAGLSRLTPGEVASVGWVFGRATEDITACYEWPLRTGKAQRATVVTRVVIEPSGRVTAATVMGNAPIGMSDCASDALMQLRFPATGRAKPVVADYPWTFVQPPTP
jgi:hypothetical protein